jgi:hypothetical protein
LHISVWLNCSAAGAMVVAAALLFVAVWMAWSVALVACASDLPRVANWRSSRCRRVDLSEFAAAERAAFVFEGGLSAC